MDLKVGISPVLLLSLVIVTVLQPANAQSGGPNSRPNNNFRHPAPLTRPGQNQPKPNPKPYSPPSQRYPAPQPYSPPQRMPPQAYPPQISNAIGMGGPGGGTGGAGGPNNMNCTMMCMMRNEFWDISPRCGYDGVTYRNECELRCKMTYEACDGTCPCYGSLNSPPSYMMLQPAPGVFPAGMFPGGSGGQNRRPAIRPRGRRPNCNCKFTNEVVCTEAGKVVAGECEAYCTYQQVKCDGPCPCLRLRGLLGGMGGAGAPGMSG